MIRITLLAVLSAWAASAALAHYGAPYEPPDGTLLHGCGWNGYDSQAYYNAMFPPEHHPLVLQVVADLPGTRDLTVANTIRALTDPIVHPDSQYIEYGLHFRDGSGMLDSVFALTTELDHYIDTLAEAFLFVNRPFFLRIGFEFNGYWNPNHPYIFPLAFRKLVFELHERGVTNFASVWCYEPDAEADFADSNAQGWKWYPGDDAVDWFGLDPFDQDHFDPALPDSFRGSLTKKGKTEKFLQFAEERGKPVYLNELSARNVFIVHDSLDPGQIEGEADWEYWFVPFFQFVRNHPGIKGWNYINLEWTRYETYETWGDARLEINTYIREHWVDSLMDGRFMNAGYDITQTFFSEPRAPLPLEASLSVYPNPFNSTVKLSFTLARSGITEIELYDVTGRRVQELFNGWVAAGRQELDARFTGLASGVYLVRVAQGETRFTAKAVLLK